MPCDSACFCVEARHWNSCGSFQSHGQRCQGAERLGDGAKMWEDVGKTMGMGQNPGTPGEHQNSW
jgi:hypothetical protein